MNIKDDNNNNNTKKRKEKLHKMTKKFRKNSSYYVFFAYCEYAKYDSYQTVMKGLSEGYQRLSEGYQRVIRRLSDSYLLLNLLLLQFKKCSDVSSIFINFLLFLQKLQKKLLKIAKLLKIFTKYHILSTIESERSLSISIKCTNRCLSSIKSESSLYFVNILIHYVIFENAPNKKLKLFTILIDNNKIYSDKLATIKIKILLYLKMSLLKKMRH